MKWKIRPCIWNVGDKEYKCRNKRESAWDAVSSVLNKKFTIEQLTAKWQNLRNQYRTSLSSSKKTKSGQGATTKPNWKYHSQMAFVGAAEAQQTTQTESNFSFADDESIASGSSISVVGRISKANGEKSSSGASGTNESTNEATNELLLTGMKCAIDRLKQPKNGPDDVQTFGNFLVSELRKIKNKTYRETTQRRLLQFLWDCMERTGKSTIIYVCLIIVNLVQFD